MWHKHRPKESEILPPTEEPKSQIDKIGESFHNAGFKAGQEVARKLIEAEEAKLGRPLTDEERKELKKKHGPEAVKKALKEGLKDIFGGEKDD